MKATPLTPNSGLDWPPNRRNHKLGNPAPSSAAVCQSVPPSDGDELTSGTRHERLGGPSSDPLASAAVRTYHVDSRRVDLFKESSTVHRPQAIAHHRRQLPGNSKGGPMQLPAGVDTLVTELLKAILVCLFVLEQVSSCFAAPSAPQKALQSQSIVSAQLLANQDIPGQATPATLAMYQHQHDHHLQPLSQMRGLRNAASPHQTPAERRFHVSSGSLEFSEQQQQHSWTQQRDQYQAPSSVQQQRSVDMEPINHHHALEAERHSPLWTVGDNELMQSGSNSGDRVSHLEPNQRPRLHQPGNLFVGPHKGALAVAGDSGATHKQPMQRQQLAPTTPSLNKQLLAPPLYELSLAPTNTIQLESGPSDHAGVLLPTAPITNYQHEHQQHVPRPSAAAGQMSSRAQNLGGRVNAGRQVGELLANQMAREFRAQLEQQQHQAIATDARQAMLAESMSNDKQDTGASSGNNNSNNRQSDASSASQQPPAAETEIEPRQRRRIFNRILKKAEWNHLFVELSKVFLRYFLDLALKDIIGKQSGSSSGSGTGDSSTSSRKKLDAQSELADLLRDFVKTAIANI